MKKAQIKRLLPGVFQSAVHRGNPLDAILDVMETMHAPAVAALDRLEENFDPHRAPDAFVPYLASWIDLEVLLDVPRSQSRTSTPSLSTGMGRLRELAASGAAMSHWRGTQKGLCMFLETATGTRGFQINERVPGSDGNIRPFHVRVTAPKEMVEHRILIERIIELEKPAYVTYELAFGS